MFEGLSTDLGGLRDAERLQVTVAEGMVTWRRLVPAVEFRTGKLDALASWAARLNQGPETCIYVWLLVDTQTPEHSLNAVLQVPFSPFVLETISAPTIDRLIQRVSLGVVEHEPRVIRYLNSHPPRGSDEKRQRERFGAGAARGPSLLTDPTPWSLLGRDYSLGCS